MTVICIISVMPFFFELNSAIANSIVAAFIVFIFILPVSPILDDNTYVVSVFFVFLIHLINNL